MTELTVGPSEASRQGAEPRERREGLRYTPGRPIDPPPGSWSTGTPLLDRRGAFAIRHMSRRVYRYLDLAVALLVMFGVLIGTTRARQVPTGIHGFLAMRVTVRNLLLLAIFCLAWMGSFAALGLYEAGSFRSTRSALARIAAACSLGSVAALLFPIVTQGKGVFNYTQVALFWALSIIAILAARTGFRFADRVIRRSVAKRIIIVGSGQRALALARQLRADTHSNNEILGFIDTRKAAALWDVEDPELGFLDEIEQTLMHTVVDEVLIALPIKSHYAAIENVIQACAHAGVQSKYLADAFEPCIARPRIEAAGDFPLMAMKVVHDDYRLAVKRAFDFLAVILSLPVTLPIFTVAAIAVKLTSPGPVLFSQMRYGRNKRLFRMYKFRTMVSNAEALQPALERDNEASGPAFKIRADPRITRIGRWLRKSSIDELPQLWNVLRGDMSLVGPRPMATRDVRLFAEPSLMRRFSVIPGLTCLWQVSGRSNLSFDRWVELDLEYIDRWSLSRDVWILIRTVPAVLKGTGAL